MLSFARASAVALMGLSLVQALSIPLSGSTGDLPAKRSFRGANKGRDLSAGAAAGAERRRLIAEKRQASKLAAKKRAAAKMEARSPRSPITLKTATTNIYQAVGFFNTAALAAVTSSRCGTDAQCGPPRHTLPDNASGKCISRACTVQCNAGYFPSAPGVCSASATTCGTATAQTVANGYQTCTDPSSNAFTTTCYTGYVLTTDSTGAPACVSVASDPNNCGAVGFVCPGSYNGVGTPGCYSGRCIMRCPPGTFQRTATGTTTNEIYYCQ